MKFNEFIANIKLLTFSKVIKAFIVAWLISFPFAPFIHSLMPETLATLFKNESMWAQLVIWIVFTLVYVILLKGIIGKSNRENAVKIGCVVGLCIAVVNTVATPWFDVSYGYLFLVFVSNFATVTALGYLLGEK